MSKTLASEFSTWESLYWPEYIPKTKTVETAVSRATINEDISRILIQTKEYKIEPSLLKAVCEQIVQSMAQVTSKVPNVIALSTIGHLGILSGLLAAFSANASLIIDKGVPSGLAPNESATDDFVALTKVSSTGDPLKDFRVERAFANSQIMSTVESAASLTILQQDQTHVSYSQEDLLTAVESFNTFAPRPQSATIAIVGSLATEFGLNSAISSLASKSSLILVDTMNDLQDMVLDELRQVFIGRDAIEESGVESQMVEFGRKKLKPFRDRILSIIVEGPVSAKLTKELEKAAHIPVLQAYGISGRGIIMANPLEFNVHGSVGIPITNTEAVIADNYEGNWMRDRVLMEPGTEGEIIVRGSFLNPQRDSGDSKQTAVKAQILTESTEWLATGSTGRMDENGFFYVSEPSFR